MFNYKKLLKNDKTHYLLIFSTIFSIDVLISLFTTPVIKKDLIAIGYLLYGIFVFLFTALILYLIRTVNQFSPADNSFFFNFWSLLLPLLQFFPIYYMYLPARFKSMSLVFTLVSGIGFSFIWSHFSDNVGESGRKVLFLWIQSVLLLFLLVGAQINLLEVRTSFSIRGVIINTAIILILTLLIIFGKKFVLWFMSHKKPFISRTAFAGGMIIAIFNIVILLFVFLSPTSGTSPLQAENLEQNHYQVNAPNVIIINMSSVRTENMEMFGYDKVTMPKITGWAEETSLYRNAYANSSWTLPSLASVFTGLYPEKHQAQYRLNQEIIDSETPLTDEMLFNPLSDDFTTLAELMSEKGFFTGAVSANFTELDSMFGLSQGFQYYEALPNSLPDILPFRLMRPASRFFTPLVKIYKPFKVAEDITSNAISFIRKNRDNSFFLYVHYMDAQQPRDPIIEYKHMYYDKDTVKFARYPKQVAELMYYNAQLRYLDDEVHRLLTKLQTYDWYDDAFIILMSDHGESIGDWGIYGNGITLANREIHVPLLVKYPGQKKAEIIERSVQLLDIFSTVLKTCNIKYSQKTDSIPLSDEKERFIISEIKPSLRIAEEYGRKFLAHTRSVIIGNIKYIFYSNAPDKMYLVDTDPEERQDMYTKNVKEAKDVKKQMFSLLETK